MSNDRSRTARRALAAALATAFLTLGPALSPLTPARAADSGDLERFLDSVVGTRGAGYAIVVDTSQSMANNGSYDKVRSVLPAFLESLHPEDLVCLIPFSGSARACDMVSRDEALAELDEALPATPEGSASNFGRAFEQALDGLQRAGTDVGGVLLLSDAQMHAPDDVKYRDFTASGWPALRKQASGLPADRTLTGYGIALAPGAEVEQVLAKVFPSYRMLDASGSRTREAMTAAQDDTRLLQAARAVTGDKGKGVAVSWPDRPGNGPVPAGSALRLRLTATTDALPVRVTDLRIEGLPEGVEPTGGLPRSVDLRPGESRDIDVTLSSTTAQREGWASGPRTETWQLSVDGRVSTPVARASERFVDRRARLATAPAGESLAVRGTRAWSSARSSRSTPACVFSSAPSPADQHRPVPSGRHLPYAGRHRGRRLRDVHGTGGLGVFRAVRSGAGAALPVVEALRHGVLGAAPGPGVVRADVRLQLFADAAELGVPGHLRDRGRRIPLGLDEVQVQVVAELEEPAPVHPDQVREFTPVGGGEHIGDLRRRTGRHTGHDECVVHRRSFPDRSAVSGRWRTRGSCARRRPARSGPG
ncbi:hypothetical protein SHIRM173S_02068 [Streptomyces hirsutus]